MYKPLMCIKHISFFFCFFFCGKLTHAQLLSAAEFVFREAEQNYVPLIEDGNPIPLQVDSNDHKGVLRAVESLQRDFERVAGKRAESGTGTTGGIWIGTVGQSALIDGLVGKGLIDRGALEGKREKFIITVLDDMRVAEAPVLIIAGSDKRGTIYGIYELSKQMGDSPWHYRADVPVERATDLYLKPGSYTEGEPAVHYRGIFLNDEYPALTRWTNYTFGGYNSRFYEKVF